MGSGEAALVNYFAHGSNLLTARIRARVPTARPVWRAKLVRHQLRFHKRGRDGSGKTDAFETGDPEDAVWGVVYEIDEAGRAALDRIEGVGAGYAVKQVETRAGDRVIPAYTYVAEDDHIDPDLRPYGWYRDLVAAGAREHGLPDEHRARIAALEVWSDPDRERAARERRILANGPGGSMVT